MQKNQSFPSRHSVKIQTPTSTIGEKGNDFELPTIDLTRTNTVLNKIDHAIYETSSTDWSSEGFDSNSEDAEDDSFFGSSKNFPTSRYDEPKFVKNHPYKKQ